jgi:hypothetical protein
MSIRRRKVQLSIGPEVDTNESIEKRYEHLTLDELRAIEWETRIEIDRRERVHINKFRRRTKQLSKALNKLKHSKL